MTKMLTLFGEDVSNLGWKDLKRERAVQRYLLVKMQALLRFDTFKLDTMQKPTQRARDKVSFEEIYVSHLEGLIADIDYWLDRKFEPEESYNKMRKRKDVVREANKIRHRRMMAEDVRTLRLKRAIEKDSMFVSWDKDKFLLVANDRGYQTEEVLIAEVAEALKLDRMAARLLLDKGRFTWGQVLLLGEMLEMSPKEFCDVFLAGYFVERNGEYRASCENLDEALLMKKNAIRPVLIEVGADGRPLDEDEWSDD